MNEMLASFCRSSRRRPVSPRIRSDPCRIRHLCRVRDSPHMSPAARQPHVFVRLDPMPHARSPVRVIAVVVVLVYCDHAAGCIDDRGSGVERLPHQPLIPMHSSYNQRRHARAIQSSAEREIVDPIFRPLHSPHQRRTLQPRPPARLQIVQRIWHLDVPAPPDHQKFCALLADALQRPQKIIHQNNVAVHIAEDVVPSQCPRCAEHIVEPLRAGFAARDIWLMAQSQLPRRLRRTRIVAKQDDFNVGLKQRPALQRVALDDCAMPDERFLPW